MAERPKSEDGKEEEDLWRFLTSRTPKAPTAPTAPKITRSDLTPEFNEELRREYDRGPRSRGQRYFDQSQESKDFKKLKEFNKKAPGRVRKIDYTKAPETHQSRILQRQMRAQSKGAQQPTYDDLFRHTEQEYRGFRMGGGKMTTSQKAGRVAGKAVDFGVRRLGPVGAVYAAWKAGTALGSQMTPAGRSAGEREDRIEENEAREEYVRSIYPGRNDDFYRSFVKGMMDEEASPPTGQTMKEILRIMELQRERDAALDEIEGIKEGTNR